ncbi:hypothetical protein [Methylibium sp. T29]|uniref:hypothetical protein n=1 Tax=Methylibium sp. T29 TaxID=1430884 RepID=UPI0012DEBC70|nr:hypothetical protein [Methylibium sp. T29]
MYGMAMRKRRRGVPQRPNAVGIYIGASSHCMAVPRHFAEAVNCDAVREVVAMTDELTALSPGLVGQVITKGPEPSYWPFSRATELEPFDSDQKVS